MARIAVQLQDGRQGTIDESEFNPQAMRRIDMQGAASQVATQQQPQQQAPQPQAQDVPQTITGRTLQEHAQALQAAKQAGDTAAVKQIQDDYNREMDYQKNFIIPDKKAEAKVTQDAQKAQNKKSADAQAIINFINNLEKDYVQGGGAQTNLGLLTRILGVANDAGAALGLNPKAENYNAAKSGFAAALKSLTGDTGTMTNQDFDRLAGLLPGFANTKEEAQGKFNEMRSQIAAKYGTDATNTTVNPKEKTLVDLGGDVFNTLLGSAKNIAQDVGTGIRGNMEQKDLSDKARLAMNLENAAAATDNPQEKKLLLQRANMMRTQISGEAGDISRSFSQDVNENPILRSILGATQIATTAEIPGATKEIASKGLDLVKAPAKMFSTKPLAAARETAAAGKTVDTSSLVKAGDNYVQNIDPAAQKAWDTLKPAIKDSTDLPELLQKLSTWGNKAYTKSGDKRAITEGLLKSHLYETGRNIIADQAPDVANLTKQMAKNIGRQKALEKVGQAVMTGVPTALAIAAATRFMPQSKQ